MGAVGGRVDPAQVPSRGPDGAIRGVLRRRSASIYAGSPSIYARSAPIHACVAPIHACVGLLRR
eukprot:894147-Rhodomonas_salina.1